MTAANDPMPAGRRPPVPSRFMQARREHRTLWLAGLAAAGVVVVAVAWILVTGWRARADLLALRHDITRLRADLVSGDTPAAREELSRAQADATAAHAQTTGPAWWTGAHLPVLGQPLRTVRGLTSTTRALSRDALPSVVAGGIALDPRALRIAPSQIDIGRLQQAQPSLSTALSGVRAGYRRVAATPGSWLGAVASGRRNILRQLAELEGTLTDTVTASRLLPGMLGRDHPRRYLVVFVGDNEARGVGGILGGYGVLQATKGRLAFSRFGTDVDLERTTSDVDFGSDFNDLYQLGDRAYDLVANADLSPNFPYAAQIWASMWQRRFGQHLDGVLCVDPHTMAAMLGVIGAVRLPDGQVLTSRNLVSLLEVGVYRRFGLDTAARKAFFVEVAQAVSEAALHRSFGANRLLTALGHAAGERRLLVYSTRAAEQSQLATTPLAGQEPDTSRPYADVVVNNAGATKLDYFLRRTVVYRRESCAAGPATVTVRLTNGAPASGLPVYMTRGRSWDGVPHPAGTNQLVVALYGTRNSSVDSVTVDGRTRFVTGGDELGHPVTELLVALRPGQTRTVVFRLHEPRATGAVLIPKQPLDQPMHTRIEAPSC